MDLDELQPGTVIAAKYRIERVLGRGGMGVVFEARHLELDQRVALKLLLPEAMKSAEAVERFLREGRASARLSSPHVAKVHDVGRLDSGQPFLVMEFLRGSDLKAIVEERGPQPMAHVVRWVLEAGDALAEAHELGIVHRDIKPANLFLAQLSNGRRVVKVVDFGISKQLDTGAVELTQTSSMMGSPLYMAPEQVMSMKHVDPRVDIWALGVVLYELATGITPFAGVALPEVIGAIMTRDPRPPSAIASTLPLAFDEVVMTCLQKKPHLRYADIASLDQALRALSSVVDARTQTIRASPVLPASIASTAVGYPEVAAVPRPLELPGPVGLSEPPALPPAPAVAKRAPSAPSLGMTHQGWGTTGKVATSRQSSRKAPLAWLGAALVLSAACITVFATGGRGSLDETAIATGAAGEAASAPAIESSLLTPRPPEVRLVRPIGRGTTLDLGDLPDAIASASASAPRPRSEPARATAVSSDSRPKPARTSPPEPSSAATTQPKKPSMY